MFIRERKTAPFNVALQKFLSIMFHSATIGVNEE